MICLLTAGGGLPRDAAAETFVGTNAPGTETRFDFSLAAGVTNLSLSVSNTATVYSYLYLKRGGIAAVTNYDQVSRLDRLTNAINLEGADVQGGTNYSFLVRTPTTSTTHPFRAVLLTNVVGLRSTTYPVTKPVLFSVSGSLGRGEANVFQVDVPTNLPGWRLVLTSSGTAEPDLYARGGAQPTATVYTKRSIDRAVDTLFFDKGEATNATWFVSVTFPALEAGNATYTLNTEIATVVPLSWDPGTNAEGTFVFTNQSLLGGDYFFCLTNQAAALGVWRTRLRALSNEADLFLNKSARPNINPDKPIVYNYASTLLGDDGVALVQTGQYATNDVWYFLVYATPGAQWTLHSGNAYVASLPSPGLDEAGGTNLVVLPEGMNFYRTTTTTNIVAWRLGLGGLTNALLVRTNLLGHPFAPAYYNWNQPGQLLLVPNYVRPSQEYFVTVTGLPSQAVTLDSRLQPVQELAFGTNLTVTATNYGYQTFHVQVPAEPIGWQIDLSPSQGQPHVAVRQNFVPNEFQNTAFAESGNPADNITLVPPTLTDGSFYITVYGPVPYSATLVNAQPIITDVPYTFCVTNDQPASVGWRYYRVTDTAAQLGSLGWELALQNQFPGTEIAVRQNALPGRWTARTNNLPVTQVTVRSNMVQSSLTGNLQRPRQAADIWYVGVNRSLQSLGAFGLCGFEIPWSALSLGPDYLVTRLTAQPAGRFQYFQVNVSNEVFGLEIHLANISNGAPRLVVCREMLPIDQRTILVNSNAWRPYASNSWPSGAQIAPDKDWTDFTTTAEGKDELGRFFFAGRGNPLEPGTYYVGVQDGGGASGTSLMDYDLLIRGLYTNVSFTDVMFQGGSSACPGLIAHDVRWHRLMVPSNAPSWQLRLSANPGDGRLVLRRDGLPNYDAGSPPATSPTNLTGCLLQKAGHEHFLLMPSAGLSNIGGTYYLAVVGEGVGPAAAKAGSNACDLTLQSEGPLNLTNLGAVDVSGGTNLQTVQSQEGGEVRGFQFTVPTNSPALEVRLVAAAGKPRMSLRADGRLSTLSEAYGYSGGFTPDWTDSVVGMFHLQNPTNGTYTLLVQATGNTNATYSLQIFSVPPLPVAFDGGAFTMTNHPGDTWRYFSVTVPSEGLGWDLRLTNVTAGEPRMVICRQLTPLGATTRTSNGAAWTPYTATNWPVGWQFAPGSDWTGMDQSAEGKNQSGQVFAAGFGNPVEPGFYVVGVSSRTAVSGTNLLVYTVVSRGIGTNSSLEVIPLAYTNGVATASNLPPREAAYFSVQVPSNSPSWQVRLGATAGESMLVVRKDGLPNPGASLTNTASPTNLAGVKLLKASHEHFLLLPSTNETSVVAGTYYVAVVSQGVNPAAPKIGSGVSHAQLWSVGPLPLIQLGAIDPINGSSLCTAAPLEGGQVAGYQFQVPDVNFGFQVQLRDRVGNPAFTLRADARLPRCYDLFYGSLGGWIETWKNTNMANIPPVAGTCTVLVQAAGVTNSYPDASYTLCIVPVVPGGLEFNGGYAHVTNQPAGSWAVWSVQVPGDPLPLGWDLRLTNVTSGDPRLVICRAQPPVDTTSKTATGQAWSWGTATAWPEKYQAAPVIDWTGLGYSHDYQGQTGRVFAVGMGNPLEPGTYYVGVASSTGNTNSSVPMSYSILSRGIGANYLIPVTALATGAVVTATNHLLAREAAYYQVDVPEGQEAWRIDLTAANGDGLLVAQQGVLPNITALTNTLITASGGGGRKIRKPGNEHFFLAPPAGASNLTAGTYYLAVISEGANPDPATGRAGSGESVAVLSSLLPPPLVDLGPVDAAGPDVTYDNIQEGCETAAFQFNLPENATRLEVSLENRTGNPMMRLRTGTLMPADSTTHGQEGGWLGQWNHTNRIVVTSPPAGLYRLGIYAGTAPGLFTNASYTLRLHAEGGPAPLDFDAGSVAVTDQSPDVWKLFQVVVPPSALGWDLRLTNVTSGHPRLLIRRDTLFRDLTTSAGFFSMTNWPTNTQVAPGMDWTGLNGPGGSSETGRVFQVGMSNPLEPGTYYVGVTNVGSNAPLTYTLVSRGIGEGFSVPVIDLPFANGLSGEVSLRAREAAWFRTVVPSNCVSWKLQLATNIGDGLLLLQKDALPSVGASPTNSVAVLAGGRKAQKPGDEHLLVLTSAQAGNTQVPPGTYYLGVVSEGVNPDRTQSRIGTNEAGLELWSAGALPPVNLGTVDDGHDLVAQGTLDGGEIKTWRYDVAPGVLAVEVAVEETNQWPLMAVSSGGYPPATTNLYGHAGGAPPQFQFYRVLTVPNPLARYALTVQAVGPSNGAYLDASYKARIRSLTQVELNFDAALNTNGVSHTITNLLNDDFRAYYHVRVPFQVDSQPVIGWKLTLAARDGFPVMRVRKDLLPEDGGTNGTSAYFVRQAVLVPEYLSPGDWYIEVRATNLCNYSLTSETLELTRPPWAMPTAGQPVTTPGLPPAGPVFADTGVETNGTSLPGDAGVDLGQDSFHYYAVIVPTNNPGLLRAQLDAISGNPNLYLRLDAPPTISHTAAGTGGPLYDRALTNALGTEHGNWVPVDGRLESDLTPGTWYLAVYGGGGSSVRYRLRLSMGNIIDLAFAGGSLTDQGLAAGDWRYYRVTLPLEGMFQQWTITFDRQYGDVEMYIRDTIPPGQGQTSTTYIDWGDDQKNHGPYPSYPAPGAVTLQVPPLRPGAVYYLGFRAKADSVFSVLSTPGLAVLPVDAVVPFMGGSYSNRIPAYGTARLRVDVPATARRWIHSATHASSVKLYLDQGSAPTLTVSDHWISSGANSSWNAQLYESSWPWFPGYSYYLQATNTSATPQTFVLRMDGEDCSNDDHDNDGLLDCWEIAWFGSIYTYGPNSDPDGDGFSNVVELQNGTNPTQADSLITITDQDWVSETTFKMVISGMPNRTHRLQSSISLVPGSWTDVTNYVQGTSPKHLQIPATKAEPSRFFRVVTP
jgi:hypothetical protein